MDPVEHAASILREAKRLVVVSGAGASTESGVPDFRGEGGLWQKFDPAEFEYGLHVNDPAGYWRMRDALLQEFDLENARPNAGHYAIASASRKPAFLGHVTQNVDGLFTLARHVPEKIVEIHGSAHTVRCMSCRRFFPFEDVKERVARREIPPPCPSCSVGALKPGVILFGEDLPEEEYVQAVAWTREADTMLVVGASLNVHPVAQFPAEAQDRGAHLIIVGNGPTKFDATCDALLRGRAGTVLPRLFSLAGLTGF